MFVIIMSKISKILSMNRQQVISIIVDIKCIQMNQDLDHDDVTCDVGDCIDMMSSDLLNKLHNMSTISLKSMLNDITDINDDLDI